VSRSGFSTKRDAEAAPRDSLVQADKGLAVLPSRRTLAEYLETWRDQGPAGEEALWAAAAGWR
jgi:hypothetical protein